MAEAEAPKRQAGKPRNRPPGRGDARPRTAARLAAVQALFQSEQSGEAPEAVLDQFVRHRLGAGGPGQSMGGFQDGRAPDADVPLFARIVRASVAQQEGIDTMLSEALPEDWKLARLDPVLRALLRAGAAELQMSDGPPARVVINEYLDVGHEFFTQEAARLANGVLDRLARLLRPGDFPAAPA
ncbi:MAG: transcription antitermination factor NusB [Rhodospirillales bacterium]|nr:transcription antitermination factor NusB [Rhodospirillales bacterium]